MLFRILTFVPGVDCPTLASSCGIPAGLLEIDDPVYTARAAVRSIAHICPNRSQMFTSAVAPPPSLLRPPCSSLSSHLPGFTLVLIPEFLNSEFLNSYIFLPLLLPLLLPPLLPLLVAVWQNKITVRYNIGAGKRQEVMGNTSRVLGNWSEVSVSIRSPRPRVTVFPPAPLPGKAIHDSPSHCICIVFTMRSITLHRIGGLKHAGSKKGNLAIRRANPKGPETRPRSLHRTSLTARLKLSSEKRSNWPLKAI